MKLWKIIVIRITYLLYHSFTPKSRHIIFRNLSNTLNKIKKNRKKNKYQIQTKSIHVFLIVVVVKDQKPKSFFHRIRFFYYESPLKYVLSVFLLRLHCILCFSKYSISKMKLIISNFLNTFALLTKITILELTYNNREKRKHKLINTTWSQN